MMLIRFLKIESASHNLIVIGWMDKRDANLSDVPNINIIQVG